MKTDVEQVLAEILDALGITGVEITVTHPENSAHGDFTTNAAMIYAKRHGATPRDFAQKIVDKIKQYQTSPTYSWIKSVEIAGLGFINIFVSDDYFGSVIDEVLREKEGYGSVKSENRNSKSETKIEKYQMQNREKVLKKQDIEQNQKKVDKKGIKTKNQVSSAGKKEKSGDVASRGKKTIMVEFAHPNTHKAFHIGHLRNITTGESMVRLLESQGNNVIRANYQGDVGMHIAKALYALLEIEPFKTEVHTVTGIKNRVEFLGKAYAAGSRAFEEDTSAQKRIKDYNYFVYAAAERFAVERGLPKPSTDYLSFVEGDTSKVDEVYAMWKETRQWSLDYFDTVYKRVYSHYDRFYFESECLVGVDIAKEAVKKGVLKESDGAIIFDGKPHGIDTRVFVNSLGLPTYEAKELALAPMEVSEFGQLSKLIHCVGPEQASFFKVTFKAEELLGIVQPGVQYHLAYGWVKLKHGKMSSRTGNVILGEWLIDEVKKAIIDIVESNTSKQIDIDKEVVSEALAIAAIKYAFLKVSTNQEIAFDLKESINTNGDSGPYLLYTYARARSVLRKAMEAVNPKSEIRNTKQTKAEENGNSKRFENSNLEFVSSFDIRASNLNKDERAVARLLSQFPDVVKAAADNFAPNSLCTYLFQLAQAFNVFYAHNQILNTELGILNTEKEKIHNSATLRLAITAATAQIIKNGLYLLGIKTLERM